MTGTNAEAMEGAVYPFVPHGLLILPSYTTSEPFT